MDFWLLILGCRGLRISCWIVGIGSLSPSCNTCVCTQPRAVNLSAPRASTKRKCRIRSHSEVNDAVGSQRIEACKSAWILTTSILISAPGRPPRRDEARIGGVARLVNCRIHGHFRLRHHVPTPCMYRPFPKASSPGAFYVICIPTPAFGLVCAACFCHHVGRPLIWSQPRCV